MDKFIDFKIIKSLALEAGFQDCAAIKAKEFDISFLYEWLNKGYNAEMQYLGNNIDKRKDPSLLLENGQTIISFIVSYNTQEFADLSLNIESDNNNNLKFATYSHFEDYHKAIKKALYGIIGYIQETYPDFKAIAFVDSSPFSEKMIAKEAGLGFIGKNSLLINKEYGSQILLGEIITNYSTDYSTDYSSSLVEDLCEDCNLCIDTCPNNAITNDKTLNANLCSSYQNMIKKGNIEESIRLEGYIYGCDICLKACPWNNKPKINRSKILGLNTSMQELIKAINNSDIDKSLFNKAKKKGAIENIKFQKLLSNIEKAKQEFTRN
ncbi:MAG: tRNA epoxyqueuosine(34) reductase QueG [Bacteroidales bacterium]|nr:tRNA epoxyqueuosine(34) reductase QueG [Bacteroidales bacterium]MDD4683747.1 tRNA epoxyqueuosine(34) reductase QueG [Bacteroidales bacterium]